MSHHEYNGTTDGPLARTISRPHGNASVHLDALRGFAAISVMLSHWRDLFYVNYPEFSFHNLFIQATYLFTGLGHQWVVVFFVLSGYLVGGSVLRAVRSNRWNWRDYLLLRSTRLYIVLLPALLLGGTADWIGTHLPDTESIYSGHASLHEIASDIRPSMTLPTLAENVLFLQTLSLPGMHGKNILIFGSNGPLWSLCNEFWYYMAFPLLVLALAKTRSWWARSLYALSLLALGEFVGLDIAWMGIPWLTGALIAYLPPFIARRSRTRSLAVIVAMSLFACGLVVHKQWPHMPATVLLGLLGSAFIWVILGCSTAPLPSVYIKLANGTSRSSYTLYLVHLPLLILFKAALHLPRATNLSWHFCLITLALLLTTFFYSYLVYLAFEKNTDRLREWIKPYISGARQKTTLA